MGPGLHPRDLELDRLEAPNGLAKGGSLGGVLHTFVDAALRRADRECGDGDPSLVEDPQEVGVTAAAFTEQVLFGNTDIGKRQRMGVRGVPADFVVRRFNGESRCGNLDHDR